ncbi:MAG: cell division protein FtsL [Desulfosudaceae bacterium]
MVRQSGKKRQPTARSGLSPIWIVILVLFLTESFLYAWCQVQCFHLRYEISQARETADRLEAQKKNLRLRLAELQSPGRIKRLAESELGLTMPEASQIVVMP